MRKFTRFMVGLDLLVAVALSLALLCAGLVRDLGMSASVELLSDGLSRLFSDPSDRLGIEISAGVLLFLHLVWLDRAIRHGRRGNTVVLEKPDGTLIIAVTAVEDSLERAVREQPGVRDVRVRVRVPHEPGLPSEVVVVCSVQDSAGILALEERMRQAVRRRFSEVLPGRELRVSVRMRRFLAEESRKAPERTYRGPEYPVEGY